MDEVSIIGIDLAKRSFQVHGARADGSVAFRRKLGREKVLDFVASQPRCVVAMEACASAHYWGREIGKLGHEVGLVPPIYVKPFVKRQKNDEADAEAICEAAQRPTMRFVAVKGEEQQARGMLFRTRDLLVRQRTQTINALRGHLAEFGVVAPQGPAHMSRLALALDDPGSGLPERVRELGGLLLGQIVDLDAKIDGLEKGAPHQRAPGRGGGAADDDPRGRADHRNGDPGLRAADGELPARARLLCLARPCAATAQHRRQAPARQDIEDGPARPQTTADHRRHGGGALGIPSRGDEGPLAGPDAGAQAANAGRGGAGQQDGAHRLGADDEQRGLPGSRRRLSGRRGAGSRRGCGQDGGQGKGKWSTRRGRENQPWPACAQARKSDLDPIRVSPYRPAAGNTPHRRGRTHDST